MKAEVYHVTNSNNVIQNSDNFEEENWDTISADKNINQKLINFHEMLTQSTEFEYIEFGLAHIYNEDPNFKSDAEAIVAFPNETVGLHGYAVGENTNKLFSLETENNQWFSPQDYFYSDGDTIPVILGNHYQKYYSTGDMLPFIESGLRLNGKIIDFLKPQSKIVHNSAVTELDDSILMPSREISEEMLPYQDETDIKFLYLSKNNGLIFTQRPTAEIREIVLQYAKSAGLSEGIQGDPYSFIDNVANIEEISEYFSFKFMRYLIIGILLTLLILVLFPLHLTRQKTVWNKSLYSRFSIVLIPLLVAFGSILLFWIIYKLSFIIQLPFSIYFRFLPTILLSISCSIVVSIISVLIFRRRFVRSSH